MAQHVGKKAPWHLWLVGGFSAIFNSIGAYDYLMTRRHDAAYFEQLGYGVAQITYFENYPVLPGIFWTVGVFGAVAASVLLLLRSRYTVPVALVALCAQAGLDVISFGFMDRLRVFGVRQSTFGILTHIVSGWTHLRKYANFAAWTGNSSTTTIKSRRQSTKTRDEVLHEWQQDPAFVREYDSLAQEFALFDELLRARQEAGLTQAEVAEITATQPSVVARLEAGRGRLKHSPSLATLQKYAEAVGCRLEIKMVRVPPRGAEAIGVQPRA